MWQKFVFVVTGYWILERLSRWLPACEHLGKQNRLINRTNRLFPAFKYLIPKVENKTSLWQRLSRRTTLFHLGIMMILGLGIAPLFTYFEQIPIVMEVEDAVGIDWLMRINRNIIPSAQDIPHFVLLDIDSDTHQQWGEPLFTPRNRIQRLIETAVDAEARLIVVDIDLSRPTPIEGLPLPSEMKRHPYDTHLVNYFEDYPKYCEEKPHCPTIILARSFLNQNTEITQSFFSIPTTLLPTLQPRPAFQEMEKAVTNSEPYIQWASPLFNQSRDNVLRRWSFWQPICLKQQPGVIPSIGVLAAVLLDSKSPKLAQDIIKQKLEPFQPRCSNDKTQSPPDIPPEITIGSLTLNTNLFSVQQRILYSMSWLQDDGEPPQLPYLLKDKAKNTILTILPAKFYATENSQVSVDSLKNSVVVIGGSHHEGHDIHQTPLGKMPGALVLINAMHSLLQYGDIKSLRPWVKQFIIAILILVMVIIFLGVESFWKGQLLNLVLVFILLPISFALFRYGYWLNFATPLIFVQLYQIAVFAVIIALCLLLSGWQKTVSGVEKLYSTVKLKITMFSKKEE